MSIIELLEALRVPTDGTSSKQGSFVVDLADSNEWGRVNSKLDHSDLLELMDDISFLDVDNGSLTYNYEDEDSHYQLALIANFDEDKYQLVVTEV